MDGPVASEKFQHKGTQNEQPSTGIQGDGSRVCAWNGKATAVFIAVLRQKCLEQVQLCLRVEPSGSTFVENLPGGSWTTQGLAKSLPSAGTQGLRHNATCNS